MVVELETNQAQVHRIIQSKAFRTSEVHRNLLLYLAEKSLSRTAMADFSRLRQRPFLAPLLRSNTASKAHRRRRAIKPPATHSLPRTTQPSASAKVVNHSSFVIRIFVESR